MDFLIYKNESCRHFQSVFNSMIDVFSSCKDINAQWGKDRNMDTVMKISFAHGQPPLLYSVN